MNRKQEEPDGKNFQGHCVSSKKCRLLLLGEDKEKTSTSFEIVRLGKREASNDKMVRVVFEVFSARKKVRQIVPSFVKDLPDKIVRLFYLSSAGLVSRRGWISAETTGLNAILQI